MDLNFDYIKKYYGVPACRGLRVLIDGKPGIIAESMGCYIGVLMDSDKPNNIMPYHPTSKVEYLGMGKVRQMTRSQLRYHEYLKVADCFESFADYLGINQG